MLADKGYDADYILEEILAKGAQAVIPPRSNRKAPRQYDICLSQFQNDLVNSVSIPNVVP